MFFDVGSIRADFTFALRPVILVACKAAELRWPTFHAVLKARFAYDLSATDISQTKSDYLKLSASTARRMLRFWLVRGEPTPHARDVQQACRMRSCYLNVIMLHLVETT
jgi:hypothetical protein